LIFEKLAALIGTNYVSIELDSDLKDKLDKKTKQNNSNNSNNQ
jgi:hypothetical protein